jgi:hypothetical protein
MERPLIAGHRAKFDAQGMLAPWTAWATALDREMQFYQQCPSDHGYPRFAYVTFLDSAWTPDPGRTDTIPATQSGMGILSYLKYYELTGAKHPAYLKTACSMGDYLVKEALTPASGKYPKFTRSTGTRAGFPLPADCGSQSDRPFEIQPDKGGIAGYALMRLFEAAAKPAYLAQALHNARVLAANQQPGDASRSPWPFRADYRSGEARGPISGNMTYILRLYDLLLAHGYEQFAAPRRSLWRWIKGHQIPCAAADGGLFAQFFEDHDTPTNRTAWAPLNLARYLLESKAVLDPEWQADSGTLIEFVRRNFTHSGGRRGPDRPDGLRRHALRPRAQVQLGIRGIDSRQSGGRSLAAGRRQDRSARPGRHILPPGPREGIVVNLPEHRLYYYPKPKRDGPRGDHLSRQHRQDGLAHSARLTHVIQKQKNPVWFPPESVRKEHAAIMAILCLRACRRDPTIRWGIAMRLAAGNGTYLIHGTNNPIAVGLAVTHGCIRMYPDDVAALFR